MSSPRLAYLLKKFPRLSETFVQNEILSQERLGAEIHVFSRRKPDDEPRHPEFRGLRATVEVLPDPKEIDPWRVLFAGRDPEAKLERVRSVVRTARDWNHPRFPGLLAEALHLVERTQELGIEHVHAHFATDSALVAMLLRELGGPTYSITAHAKDIYRNTVDVALLDRLFGQAEFVVTVCDANVRFLAERLGARAMDHVRRLYNGVDLSTFSPSTLPREPAHVPSPQVLEPQVLSIGRLIEKKGFHVLLEALALLERRGLCVEATFVGEGEERPRLERRIAELGLGDGVRLVGALDQDQVRGLLRTAAVLCLPCLVGRDGNRDALPTVLLEALASGLPAISTPVTGIPEILDHGRAGVLVPENDPLATADALEELLRDPGRRDRLARAGRARAEELFDARKNALTLRGWFEEALERRAACASPA